jgi:PLP dependent protein
VTIAERLSRLRRDIDDELRGCGRVAGSVEIVGVSKLQPPGAIAEAAAAGLRDVAENYVQEAKRKFTALNGLGVGAPLRKHFIGHVQTNKAKAIVELFDVVQSVDREDAARALGRAASHAGKQLPVLVQLNISAAERFGCRPEQAESLAEAIRAEDALRLAGVMAIGPITGDAVLQGDAFSLAAKTLDRIGGSTLSIGMSADWRAAVRAGSTMVRIGTALFGTRG